jgi:hypothetical protein
VDKVKVIVHYGYKYKRGKDLFKQFIKKYYNLKKESEQSNNEGKRTIAKLMLNSLYGRFGLKYQNTISKFVSFKEAIKLLLTHQIE